MYYEEDILNTFERLPLRESISHASMIPVMECDRLDSYLVKLDDILSYQDANSMTLDECLDNICEENNISKDHIAISYIAENALTDDEYLGVLSNFAEANYDIYALGSNSPYKDILSECIDEYLYDDTTGQAPLNELFNTFRRAVSSQAGARTSNTLKNIAGNVVAGAKLGLAQATANKADRFIGGFLDKVEKDDRGRDKITKNGKVTDKFGQFTSDVVQGMRKNATEGINNTLRNFMGVDKNGNNTPGILSLLNSKMNQLRNQQASERDPNRKNVITRTIDKLKNLINAVTNRNRH